MYEEISLLPRTFEMDRRQWLSSLRSDALPSWGMETASKSVSVFQAATQRLCRASEFLRVHDSRRGGTHIPHVVPLIDRVCRQLETLSLLQLGARSDSPSVAHQSA